MRILAHKIIPYNPLSVQVTAEIADEGEIHRLSVVCSNTIPVERMLEMTLSNCVMNLAKQRIQEYLSGGSHAA